jgi:hypothetical protein
VLGTTSELRLLKVDRRLDIGRRPRCRPSIAHTPLWRAVDMAEKLRMLEVSRAERLGCSQGAEHHGGREDDEHAP